MRILILAILSLTSPSVLAGGVPVFHLTVKNARFIPTLLKVPQGVAFKLIVRNEGPGAEEFESNDLNREKIVLPGREITVSLGPLKAGSYGFFGDFHPDTAQGKLIAE